MENVQECNENTNTEVLQTGEIIKPLQQQQQQQQPKAKELENIQQQQLQEEPQQQQQQEQQRSEEAIHQNETPGEITAEAAAVKLNADFEREAEEDDDEDYEDDDEEKETSQKLIIDIPDEEEEEEEEEEKEEDEDDDEDVIPIEDVPTKEHLPAKEDNNEKKVSTPTDNDAIITLSDGEEDIPANELTPKPGKVQKRRSAGSRAGDDEEQFRLKRRKINVAGAPKMPVTGYVRYMHDRRESLRKEHPTKTSMEHTKMIGEEWHSLPADVKASYLKAADDDKQRLI